MPGAITHEIESCDAPPPGYVTLTEFAAEAGVRRGALAKEAADGEVPFSYLCHCPGKGRYGKVVYMDLGYLREYLDCRTVSRKAPPKPKARKKPKSKLPKKAKKPEVEKPLATSQTPRSRTLRDWSAPKSPPIISERKDNLADAEVDLDTKNTRSKAYWVIEHTRLKAIREALELQKARNEVLSVAQAAETVQQILLVIRQTMLSIPGRVAPALSGETDVIRIRDFLEREIKRALKELSKAKKYTEVEGGQ